MAGSKLIFFLFILMLSFGLRAQEFSLKIEKVIKGSYDAFSVDNFGRIYLVKDDVVQQLSKEYDTLFTASLKTFFPFSIESRKSFRSLLFDKDRSSILFLDNTLTNIYGDIDLVEKGIQQPILVCESFNGNAFWILDAANMRLIKMNDKLQILSQTENLVHLFDSEIEPSQMIESNDFLYILVPNKGVAVFDVFGTYIRFIDVEGSSINGYNQFLLVANKENIQVFDSQSRFLEQSSYTYPKNAKQFHFTQHNTYFLTDQGLEIGKYIAKEP